LPSAHGGAGVKAVSVKILICFDSLPAALLHKGLTAKVEEAVALASAPGPALLFLFSLTSKQ
jgi:hypothetical protein